jgi:hypothetical protein
MGALFAFPPLLNEVVVAVLFADPGGWFRNNPAVVLLDKVDINQTKGDGALHFDIF